jgi:hypothetical protein
MMMKTCKWRSGLSILGIIVLVIILHACDSMEDDAMPKVPTVTLDGNEVYVLKNGTAYIDLYSKINTNGRVNLNISRQPAKGSLSEVAAGLLKYKPSGAFTNGRDVFTFSVFSESNQLIKTDSVIIIVGDTTSVPCGIYPGDDWVNAASTPVDVFVLSNDLICGDSTDIILEIYKPGNGFPPYHGTATVTSNNWIRYTSSNQHVMDTIVYKVTKASDPSIYGFGTVYINTNQQCWPHLPEKLLMKSDPGIGLDSVSIWLTQGAVPICGKIYDDSLSIVNGPDVGSARVEEDWIWYVYELTESRRTISDSLVYRICDGNDCLDGKIRIRIN